jgi:hypothetical protein
VESVLLEEAGWRVLSIRVQLSFLKKKRNRERNQINAVEEKAADIQLPDRFAYTPVEPAKACIIKVCHRNSWSDGLWVSEAIEHMRDLRTEKSGSPTIAGKIKQNTCTCRNRENTPWLLVFTFYIYCRVDKSVDTKVSEEHITSIFRTKDGGSMCHLNLGIHTEFHTDSFRCWRHVSLRLKTVVSTWYLVVLAWCIICPSLHNVVNVSFYGMKVAPYIVRYLSHIPTRS